MTELATLAVVLITLVVGGLAFTIGIVLVRRVMRQWNDERRRAPAERVAETLETAPDIRRDGPRGGAV